MTGAELGLAIVASVDLCFKYSETFIELCAAFKNAETEVAERIIRFEANWLRTKGQLLFLRSIARTLDSEFQVIHNDILKVLASKLDCAGSRLDAVLRKTDNQALVKKWKFALAKESLDKTIDELETWQKIFDPSWFLLMKAAAPEIDVELNQRRQDPGHERISSALSLRAALSVESHANVPILLPEDGLRSIQLTQIPFCSAMLGNRGSGREIILERILRPSSASIGEINAATMNIRDLARRLYHSDPATFRLLSCKGIVKRSPSKQQDVTWSSLPDESILFDVIFRVPAGFSAPQTLRSCLLEGEANHSLSDRFQLASELAKAIVHVHNFGFVHKNIRPETVLIFQDGRSTIGSAFLTGFEQARIHERQTFFRGDSTWEKNLYRHPQRRGLSPLDVYIMQHDIYSLGVSLLEIGMWESFVIYNQHSEPGPSKALNLDSTQLEYQRQPREDQLLDLARNSLPLRMGTKYAKIVETCLTCLNKDNGDFGDGTEFEDEYGLLVGSRYIEKVLMRLNEISL